MVVELRVVRDRAPSRGGRRPAERARAEAPTLVEPLDVVVARSIGELGRREWDSLFPGELEDWAYLRAVEDADLEGCDPVYFAIKSRDGLVAAAPAFVGRRALGEPWRGSARSQWRRARERMLVLGSPLSAGGTVGLAPRASGPERTRLVELVLGAAHGEATRLGLEAVLVQRGAAQRGDSPPGLRPSTWLPGARRAATARLAMPPWSFSDYLSCFDERLRGHVLRACAQAAAYERDWRVDLERDLEPMLALCRAAGLDEINGRYFENLLGPSVDASCLVVRLGGKLAGFSVLLHDARALREKLTVVSRRVKGSLVRTLIWLETIRFCLESGIGAYESSSELSLAAERPSR